MPFSGGGTRREKKLKGREIDVLHGFNNTRGPGDGRGYGNENSTERGGDIFSIQKRGRDRSRQEV